VPESQAAGQIYENGFGQLANDSLYRNPRAVIALASVKQPEHRGRRGNQSTKDYPSDDEAKIHAES